LAIFASFSRFVASWGISATWPVEDVLGDAGWEKLKDAASGKEFYYGAGAGVTTWTYPALRNMASGGI
jgi:hypothetical protein